MNHIPAHSRFPPGLPLPRSAAGVLPLATGISSKKPQRGYVTLEAQPGCALLPDKVRGGGGAWRVWNAVSHKVTLYILWSDVPFGRRRQRCVACVIHDEVGVSAAQVVGHLSRPFNYAYQERANLTSA